MTKEEMKDRISMALKDPILQQGFEIICKENAELKKEVEKHKWNDIFLEESAFYDKKIAEEYTTLQERIAELEKENAELEKENAELEKENKELKTIKIPQLERRIASIRGAHSVDCKKLNAKIEQVERLKKQVSAMSKALVNVVSESDKIRDRLSKAIKVIKALRNDYYADAKRLGVWEQTEQFLKEIEE